MARGFRIEDLDESAFFPAWARWLMRFLVLVGEFVAAVLITPWLAFALVFGLPWLDGNIFVFLFVWGQEALRPLDICAHASEVCIPIAPAWIFVTSAIWLALAALGAWVTRSVHIGLVAVLALPAATLIKALLHLAFDLAGFYFQYDFI